MSRDRAAQDRDVAGLPRLFPASQRASRHLVEPPRSARRAACAAAATDDSLGTGSSDSRHIFQRRVTATIVGGHSCALPYRPPLPVARRVQSDSCRQPTRRPGRDEAARAEWDGMNSSQPSDAGGARSLFAVVSDERVDYVLGTALACDEVSAYDLVAAIV